MICSRIARLGALIIAAGVFLALSGQARADDLFFRPGGDIPSGTTTYDWDKTTADWYSTQTGGTGQTWSDNNKPIFRNDNYTGASQVATIRLTDNMTVSGLEVGNSTFATTSYFLFTSINPASRQTLTFANGSEITGSYGATRQGLRFQDINLAGNFTKDSIGSVVFQDVTFDGTLTYKGGTTTRLLVAGTIDGADFVLDGPSLSSLVSGAIINGKVSGTGGIRREAVGSLTLNQNVNSVLTGVFITDGLTFTKGGTGAFIFGDGTAHTYNQNLNVTAGSMYLSGTLPTGGSVVVSENATFGGSLTSDKSVTLSGATSALTPGQPTLGAGDTLQNQAGTMTLSGGLIVSDGGTFNFWLDGEDNDNLVNSRIDIADGALTLAGTKTVNLYSLGAGLIEMDTAYTLIDFSGASSKDPGWDSGWQVGVNETGYAVQSLQIVGDELQVNLIPEPSSILLFVSGSSVFFLMLRRRMRRG